MQAGIFESGPSLRGPLLALATFFALLTGLAAPLAAEPIRGAGSTFVAPLMERWQQRFREVQADGGDQLSVDLGVDYEPVGSLAGVMRASQLGMDFGVTERPLTTAELARDGLGQFPLVMGGISIVANLEGVAPGALQLTGPVLADIYLGRITTWNAPAIAALNPGLTLPAAPIKVVHRSDGSGTTYNLAVFLSGKSEAWKSSLGADTELRWTTGLGARGNAGVARAVRETRNAIGYVESGLAARLGLADVRLQNRSGAFVRADAATISEAALGVDWAKSADFDLLIVDSPGAGAYPLVATVFVVAPKKRTPSRRAAFQFFRFALGDGSRDALDLGYVPLPAPLVQTLIATWPKTFTGAR
jgi:phosphate transport system substrate-binding protein